MATEIVMPQMGAEMEEGTIVRWLKQPGEFVKRGEVIGEIETDKATVDLESFEEGYFLGSVVADGTTVPVGAVIGFLGAQGEQLPGAAPSPSPSPTRGGEDGPHPPSPPVPRGKRGGPRLRRQPRPYEGKGDPSGSMYASPALRAGRRMGACSLTEIGWPG